MEKDGKPQAKIIRDDAGGHNFCAGNSLHHLYIPQRSGSTGVANQRWNLQMANSQFHAAMDKHRHINYEISRINSHLNKWQGKIMNKEDFIDLLEDYLNKHKNASCLAGRDGDGFIDKMYLLLIKDSPSNINQWLKTNMEDRFLYATEPPKWTRRGEKDWLYFDNEPMIFLHQFYMGLKEAKKMKGKFPVGETIYVFGGNKKIDQDTWQTVYRMIGQDNSEGYRVHIDYV